MRQGSKGQVEVIRQFAVFELGRFADGIPDAIHIGFQRSLQIAERCSPNVVSDNEEEQGPTARST